MINILDHPNNLSIAFAMTEHLGLVTLILNIPVILANIQGFFFSSHLAEKGCPGTITVTGYRAREISLQTVYANDHY